MRTLLLLWGLLLWSCQSAPSPSSAPNSIAKDTTTQKSAVLSQPDPYWTDLARLLAGFRPNDTLYWRSAIRDTVWQAYARELERLWNIRKAALYDSLAVWAARELQPYHTWKGKVFYPFSGADWVTINTIYPQGEFYLFFGLEQEGDPHLLRKLSPSEIVRNLRGTYLTLEDLLRVSFFYTKDMQIQLSQGKIRGLLPVFLALFGRTGYAVYSVEHIYLKEGGIIDTLSDTKPKPAQSCWDNPVTGLRFQVGRPGGPVQEVVYISINAENAGLDKLVGVREFVSRMRPCVTLIKSASYLLFGSNFSEIRRLILTQSVAILEEDSGIPLRFFDTTAWVVQPFGVYNSPIPLFRRHFQSDLYKLYRTPQVKPLPFNIGYHTVPGQSNLLWVMRKDPQATLPPLPDEVATSRKREVKPLAPRPMTSEVAPDTHSKNSVRDTMVPIVAPSGGSE